jgi:FMN-dependent NADH-azoreductase
MILGFVGVTDLEFVAAEGIANLERGKVGRDEYLRPIREQVRLKGRGGLAALKS